MRDYLLQARISLEKYVERGNKALQELRANNIEVAMEELKMQRAAFHNFRCADYLLLANGIRVEDEVDPELIDSVSTIDQEICSELELTGRTVKTNIVRLRETRMKIGKFRSQISSDYSIERSV